MTKRKPSTAAPRPKTGVSGDRPRAKAATTRGCSVARGAARAVKAKTVRKRGDTATLIARIRAGG